METEKDRDLWKIAKKRVGFKRHLTTYIIINTMLWLFWLFNEDKSDFPWPLWPMLGWGVGLAFNYREAYISPNNNSIEKEYEKLKKK
ncbi:2TM domain-containing protein [Aurantibacillus circumpalustris]|uniref:2TM domain-containing protein n=1 Tax=Aurantibacillus circumpalustris TaxID=3036359 RepID=UPI00295BB85A|nr:2TM domain-containing protein [Aurantibacillus circumpalustris]